MSSYVTDPIGDLLARIRNAQRARRHACRAPWSRLKQELCELLRQGGWIAGVATEGEDPRKELVVTFADDHRALELVRVSKPGRRVYQGYRDTKPVLRGYGATILTTNQGLMTDTQARKKRLGGEVLCTIS